MRSLLKIIFLYFPFRFGNILLLFFMHDFARLNCLWKRNENKKNTKNHCFVNELFYRKKKSCKIYSKGNISPKIILESNKMKEKIFTWKFPFSFIFDLNTSTFVARMTIESTWTLQIYTLDWREAKRFTCRGKKQKKLK